MRFRFLFLVLCGAWVASCNCGGSPPCVSASCQPPDGGGKPDAGGLRDAGGRDAGGGADAGDSGCVNLQCRQAVCPASSPTRVSGSVYDPSGTLPLYNAVVYVPNGATAPFTPGVSCDRCGAFASGAPLVVALTGPDGRFVLKDVPAGANVPLVIQIGRWRRQVTLPPVVPCADNPLSDVNLTRMPRNQAEGDIPLTAISTGKADPFECLLLKMGIEAAEFTPPDGPGRIHYYVENGIVLDGGAPAGSSLWTDAGTLGRYDVVILPCESGERVKPAFATQNIVDYTSAGGRMFTTHYGYAWIALAPPPFPATATWIPDPGQKNNPPNPFAVDINQAFPKGQAFAQWLANVGASPDAGQLSLVEARHNVWNVDAGTTAWMWGTVDAGPGYNAVSHLTFNTPFNPPPLADGDAGVACGRVVFSDFHVTTSALTKVPWFPASCASGPFTPQEKALVFMLFDLSSCVQSDSIAPQTCQGVGQTCTLSGACCNGLACVLDGGLPCTGGAGCACEIVIQ